MWFIWALGWISLVIQFAFASLAVASGLYYLAELVEEFTSAASKIIRVIILVVFGVFVGFLLFEDFPLSMTLCGMGAQIAHLYVMQTFPYFAVTSPAFISTIVFVIINHYLAFSHFSSRYYPFVEVMAYFTVCMWMVPFAFFVSLSANDLVLPTQAERTRLLGDDNDVVSNYFKRKGKKYGLLQFFNSAKDLVLPQRTKKTF